MRNISRKDIIIYLFMLIGIAFRILMMLTHFTHWDDIGVANFILQLQQISKGNEIDIAKDFSDVWTYGPLQILITQKLINANMSYFLNIFMGRLPSLICNVIFIVMIFITIYKIQIKEKYGKILIICIISLSWENIIYSAQMEPYSIGILFSTIILYFIIYGFYDNWNKTILATFLFTIGCYAQYQMFILVFAAYGAVFLINIKNKNNLIKVVFAGIVNFVLSIPLLLFLLNTGKLSQGVNSWNIGKDGMFRYQSIADGTFVDKIEYTITFFSRNIFMCFKYLFLANSYEYVANILTIMLLVFACLGVYYVHKYKEYIAFALFHDILAVVLLIMILKGSVTLGPSRHILFLEPVWIILMYFGIIQLMNIKNLKLYCKKIYLITTCLIALLFVFSLPQEIATRKNFVSEKYVNNLINKYEPKFVFAESNLDDLYLFHIDGYLNNSMSLGSGWLQNSDINVSPQNNDTIILMSRNYSIEDIQVSESRMKQQLEERLNYFKLDMEWANIDNYMLVYRKEIPTDAEVEYARKYYWNYPNGLFLYVLKYSKN